jgi:hypothetical protein
MFEELKKRRLALLYSLHQRGDGVLQMAAWDIGRVSGGPAFELDKRELLKEGAIEDVTAPGLVGAELYRVTPRD